MILRVLLYMEVVLAAIQGWQLFVRARVRKPRGWVAPAETPTGEHNP